MTSSQVSLLSLWLRPNAALCLRGELDSVIESYVICKGRLARHYMRRERAGNTLQTTAQVNEAYLRLVDQKRVCWQNRAHFFGIAAQLMRRILIERARKRSNSKRGARSGVGVQ